MTFMRLKVLVSLSPEQADNIGKIKHQCRAQHRRLRRACANAKTRQNIRCTHTQSMDEDEESDQSLDLLVRWIRKYGRFKGGFLRICDAYQNLICWPIYKKTWKTDPSEIERTYNIRKQNGFIESVHEN